MSWEQLVQIYHENDEVARANFSQPPVDCPNDGTVLQAGPDGVLFCPFDGWQYPRDHHPC